MSGPGGPDGVGDTPPAAVPPARGEVRQLGWQGVQALPT